MWNILIAEDDLDKYKDTLASLEKIARCTIVRTGEEALLAYRESLNVNAPFDFILLDVTMPGINGFDVLQAIRQEEEMLSPGAERGVFIIIVTAYKDSLMEYYDMGWDDFITKPIETEKLLTHMHNLMATRTSV